MMMSEIMRAFARGRGFVKHGKVYTNGQGIFSNNMQLAGRNKMGIWILPRGTVLPSIEQSVHLEQIHRAFPFAGVGSLNARRG